MSKKDDAESKSSNIKKKDSPYTASADGASQLKPVIADRRREKDAGNDKKEKK